MKFKVLLLMISYSLSACVEVTDLDQERKNTNEMHYQAVEHPEPNRYSVVIPLQPGEQAVRKVQDFNKLATAPIQMLNESQMRLVDENVIAGERYYYQLGSLEGGSLHITRAIDIVVPRDRVFIPGEQGLEATDLDPRTFYGRIFFLKGSKVRTDGANWNLRANKVISENGEIYTFPDGTAAGMGRAGRSGGEIRMNVREIYGVVNVTLRGEHGGQGKPGDEIPGRAGQGTPGRPGKGKMSPPRSNVDYEICTEKAISAGDGVPGLKQGNRGYEGGRGGDSGNLYVEITGNLYGQVRTNFYEGLGGLPGDGGLGQRGGAPGDFDEKKNFTACEYREAHEGPRGPQGEQGSSGLPGLRGKVCRKIGKSKVECRQDF